jgi:putative sigma-54 modulation protein
VNIVIRARTFSITGGLRAHVERRVAFALDRYVEQVARVSVIMGDVNGPRGGRDKSCRVEVRVRDGRAVRATALDADAYAAIGAAVRRAAGALGRQMGRERTAGLEHAHPSDGAPPPA